MEYLAFFAEARRSVRERAGALMASLPQSRTLILIPQSHDLLVLGLALYRARPDKGYPKDMDGSMPVAYLWTRTIRCEVSVLQTAPGDQEAAHNSAVQAVVHRAPM